MLVVSFLLLVREIKRLKGLGECLLFERNEVEHYKETWCGNKNRHHICAFSNNK
jgi:hypothetical protein